MATDVRPSDFLRQVISETGISQSDVEIQDGRDDSALALMKLAESRPQVEKHRCLFCHAEFTIALDLYNHISRFHSIRKDFECLQCGRLFKHERQLLTHARNNHRKPFPCQVCSLRFGSKLARERHSLVHAEEKPYDCPICFKTFRKKTSFEDHVRIHTGEKPYVCYICNEFFGGTGELSLHVVKEHPNTRLFQCDVCDRMFQSGKRFMRHRRDHDIANQLGERPLKCTFCPVYFTDLQQIEHHIKQVHPINSKPTRTPVTVSQVTNHHCSECQYYYETYEDLSIHLESVHMLFQCRYCYLQYTSKQALKTHIRQSHGSFHAISCHICDRTFTDQGSLTRHVAMHDKFTCPHCDASFPGEVKLKTHVSQAHSPDNMESCNICGQNFAVKSRLQRHLQCHLPPALHKCKICLVGFNQEKMVARHMEIVHKQVEQKDTGPSQTYQIVQDGTNISVVLVGGAGARDIVVMLCGDMENLFTCSICSLEFVEKGGLLTHMTEHEIPELVLALVDQERTRSQIAGVLMPKEIIVSKSVLADKENGSDSEDDLEEMQHEAFMRSRPKSAAPVVVKRYTSTRCCFCDKLLASEHDLQVHEKMHVNNYDFRCTACNEEFVDGDDLIKHRRMHKKRLRRSYQCAHCGIIMNDANLMKQHIDTHSGFAMEDEQLMISTKPAKKSRESKFACSKCRLWFIDGKAYRQHMGTHRDGKAHRCRTCGRGYNKMSSLKFHQKSHQAVAPLGCNHCSERFHQPYKLTKHLLLAHNIGQFVCHKCDLRFHSREERSKHEKKHKNRDSYPCALCDAVFVTVDAFKRHVQSHESKLPLKKKQDQENVNEDPHTHWCVICEATFEREEDLIAHGSKHFKCDLCATEFADAMELECHTLDHAALERNICLNCGDTFQDHEGLWEHVLNAHSENQSFRCEKCHCLLLSYRHSQIHMLTHPLEVEADYHCDYFCNMCQMIFTTESFLNIHNERHKPCQICSELPDDLTLHLLQNHSLPQVEKCYHCDRVLTDPVTRAEHLNTHAVSPDVLERCGDCESGFADMETLDEHTRSGHNLAARKCIICGMLCLGKEGLAQHLTSEHMVYSIQRCSQCPLIFLNTSSESMEKHLQSHKPKTEMSCCACGVKFTDKDLLKSHIVQTHGENIANLYGCCDCSQKFSAVKDLRVHLRVEHGLIGDTDSSKLICGICSKKVVISKVAGHVVKHLKSKPYSCIVCSLSFTTRASMDRHYLAHSDDRPLVCEVCGEGFRNADRLKEHQITHIDEKIYDCEEFGCDEHFRLATKLCQHAMRKHGLSTPSRCSICHQKFVSKDHLLEHMSRHGGGRRFRCHVCQITLQSYENLRQHLKKKHNERTVQCENCQAILPEEERSSHVCAVTQAVVTMETEQAIPAVAMGADPVAIAMSQISTNQDGDGFVYIAMDEGGECCPICMAQFANQDELRYHMILHQDVNGLPS